MGYSQTGEMHVQPDEDPGHTLTHTPSHLPGEGCVCHRPDLACMALRRDVTGGSGGVGGYLGMRLTFLSALSRQDFTCRPHPLSLVAGGLKTALHLTKALATWEHRCLQPHPPPACPALAPWAPAPRPFRQRADDARRAGVDQSQATPRHWPRVPGSFTGNGSGFQ